MTPPVGALGARGARALSGGCGCGAVRFQAAGPPAFSTLCHCGDCRRFSGAPAMAWAMVPADGLAMRGAPRVHASSESGRRSFCGACGTTLLFSNAALARMGMVQVAAGALDEAVEPRAQVQAAERLPWMAALHEVPAFERFPPAG